MFLQCIVWPKNVKIKSRCIATHMNTCLYDDVVGVSGIHHEVSLVHLQTWQAVADPEGGARGVPRQLIARVSLVQSMSHIKYSSECTITYCTMTKYTQSPEATQAFCVWGETSKFCVDVEGVLSTSRGVWGYAPPEHLWKMDAFGNYMYLAHAQNILEYRTATWPTWRCSITINSPLTAKCTDIALSLSLCKWHGWIRH